MPVASTHRTGALAACPAHWTLHVWLYKTNPAGLFAPFNPDVDCP